MLVREISPLALGPCVPQFLHSASVMSTLLFITRMHPPSPVPDTPVSALMYPSRNPTPEKLILEPSTMFISRCVPPPSNHERPKLALHILRFFPPETQCGGTSSAYKKQRVLFADLRCKAVGFHFCFQLESHLLLWFLFSLFFSFSFLFFSLKRFAVATFSTLQQPPPLVVAGLRTQCDGRA